MNREQRRAAIKAARYAPPSTEQLEAVLRSDAPGEVKQGARAWLRFPGTRAANIVGRSAALAKRREAGKRAKAARKVTRRRAK